MVLEGRGVEGTGGENGGVVFLERGEFGCVEHWERVWCDSCRAWVCQSRQMMQRPSLERRGMSFRSRVQRVRRKGGK